jgi:hypothetical protein
MRRVVEKILVFGFLLVSAGAFNVSAQTVWAVCRFDTSSIIPQKGEQDKFERRFYVSQLVSLSKSEFLKMDGVPERIEGNCGAYFEKTVYKAATDRGERIDTSGSLKVIRNIEHTDDGVGYKFSTKEEVQKLIDAEMKEAVDFGRVVYYFNWDVSGKSEADDLKKENNRTSSKLTAQPLTSMPD